MAQYFFEANTDGKADWTEVGAGNAFDRLNDGTRQPTAPDTGTDYIESATNGQISRHGLTTQALAGGETVVSVRFWFYVITPAGRNVRADINIPTGGTIGSNTVPAGSTGWQKVELAAPFTQAQLDGMEIQFINGDGTGTTRVYSAYVEVNTRTDVWAAANAKLQAGRNASTGLSVGSGSVLGSDIGPSVDLGGGRSLLYGGDAAIATGAGQQFYLGTNTSNSGAARATLVGNIALLLNSYEVEAATFTYYTGASNTPYHPDHVTYGRRWPYQSFIQDTRLFTVGRFSSASGSWAAYTDNFSGAPNTWTWTYLPTFPQNLTDRPNCEWGIWDDESTWVYCWSSGPQLGFLSATDAVTLCRLPRARFNAGDWTNPEWWTGTEFKRDKKPLFLSFPPGALPGKKHRGNAHAATPRFMSGQGSVVRRAVDDKFQALMSDDTLLQATPYVLRYALTASTNPASFGSFSAEFTIPDGEEFVYGAAHHPQLTWSGMGANDQVWSYASNWYDLGINGHNTWEPLYFTRFVKATSIT
jgi:hypothetical protein